MRLADHEVVSSSRHVVAESGNGGEARSGEWLEEVPVCKAVSRRQLGRSVQRMFQPHIEVIVAVAQNRRRDKVLKRNVAIGRRIQRRDCPAYRVDEQIRDLVSSERLLSERIDRRSEETLREVAPAFRQSRDVGNASDSLAHPRALVVDKEKRSVFGYRTAQRKTKLIALIFWRLLVSRCEEVARVESPVAKELVG